MVKIIDGKQIAKDIREELKKKVDKLINNQQIFPKLAVILIGNDPASSIYVRNKEKACGEIGIISETKKYDFLEEKDAINLINSLNSNNAVHGILVQLPLPKGLDAKKIISTIDPSKDVDGLGYYNMGKLLSGEEPLFLPCTPQGIMRLLLSTGIKLEGKEAVVVGRSNIVGKPIALMLLAENSTVTICHSRTKNLKEVCQRADILVAAVGKPRLIKGDWIKRGAAVIDVGTSRVEGAWVGDVDFEEAKGKADFLTPVPGGVGPMTIAMLLKNTVAAAERLSGNNSPDVIQGNYGHKD